MLVLRRKKGEAIKIGDNITVTVSDIARIVSRLPLMRRGKSVFCVLSWRKPPR